MIHATSDSEQADVTRYHPVQKICVVPNGISITKRPNKNTTEGRIVLSLGRIHKKKALDHLLRAWRILEPDFPDWSLVLAGPGEDGELAKLRSMIYELRLIRVKILGPVFGDEKLRLMASASLFALPSHSENFAFTVGESLMLGVPVVSSQGAPWFGLEAERCGRWVPIGATSMAEGLRDLMRLSDFERQQMGERGRSWMLRDFSWQSVGARLKACYEELV